MSSGYYNFTPAGTQYSTPGNYGLAAPGYGAQANAQATAPVQPNYAMPGYNQMTAPATAYGYGAAQQPAVQVSQQQQTGAYMPPPHLGAAGGSAAATATSYNRQGTTTGSAMTGGYFATPAAPVGAAPAAAVPTYQQVVAPSSTGGGPVPSETTYSGYDAALYAAAKSYLASKATGTTNTWMSNKKNAAASTYTATTCSPKRWSGGGGSMGGGRGSFPRKGGAFGGRGGGGYFNQAPSHTYFCEICKISCQALQTYNEHLEGKTHKKKEALVKSGPTNVAKSKSSFFCAICEVLCTGADTYQMHIKGAKHLKTVKLHQQMGKPLPAEETKIIPPASKVAADQPKKVVVVQKVNFVGGDKLTSTTGSQQQQIIGPTKPHENEHIAEGFEFGNEVAPVGEDYLEMVTVENGKAHAFHCKLCDCRFTDLNAKDMHMKGRRHRLNYKKKVNPDLEVEIKPNTYGSKMRRMADDRGRRELMKMRQQDVYSMRATFQGQMEVPASFGNVMIGAQGRQRVNFPRNTNDDRYIMSKHDAIYPSEQDFGSAQRLILAAEKALKLVSDHYAEMDRESKSEAQKLAEIGQEDRLLKGVMRVGDLAKNLLLKGDLRLELVVLCSSWPTDDLLHEIASLLPTKLEECGEGEFEVNVHKEDAAILIKPAKEALYELKIVFTSVVVREEEESETSIEKEAMGMLDKQKCLHALASLRHAKWFQARCANLQFGPLLLRLLKDLRQRVPSWAPLTSWPAELLVEKVLNTNLMATRPSEALYTFFEAIASGIVMKCGPGLLDPCEKTSSDVLATLTGQQREDITASAQHILRLMAFDQLYTVLGIEKMSSETNGQSQRKRPRDSAEPAGQDTNGKKDKKGP